MVELIRNLMVEDKEFVFYRPKMRRIAGSVTAAILLEKIHYWWNKAGRKPFYKFFQPCSHEQYKLGDSWEEELGFSRDELSSALEKIGTKITKGTSKNEVLSRTERKALVIYWTDSNRVTWFQLNEGLFYRLVAAVYCNGDLSDGSLPDSDGSLPDNDLPDSDLSDSGEAAEPEISRYLGNPQLPKNWEIPNYLKTSDFPNTYYHQRNTQKNTTKQLPSLTLPDSIPDSIGSQEPNSRPNTQHDTKYSGGAARAGSFVVDDSTPTADSTLQKRPEPQRPEPQTPTLTLEEGEFLSRLKNSRQRKKGSDRHALLLVEAYAKDLAERNFPPQSVTQLWANPAIRRCAERLIQQGVSAENLQAYMDAAWNMFFSNKRNKVAWLIKSNGCFTLQDLEQCKEYLDAVISAEGGGQ